MIDDNRFDKIRWNSRRGMKELDLMLEPFVESYLPTASEEIVNDYEYLLECSDLELVRFVLRRQVPTDERILKIVNIIISYHDELLSKENN
ncbi:MAG: succinate dehydrogenase assembly factor 2 [Ruminobacter sp.]|jgi:antitoxin CptB|nr:succinate dehydrogenase assembly factor 2 [Ruminobacter sp.]